MIMGLVTVILVDAILFVLIRLVETQLRQQNKPIPMIEAAALFLLCCVGHYGATKTVGRGVTSFEQARLGVLISAGFGFVPIWAYVHMLMTRIQEATHTDARIYAKAHALRVAGDINGALLEYLRCFDKDRTNPTPLFSAAGMLELEKDYDKAGKLFAQIMDRFEKDEAVWARAAYRLVDLRNHHLDDAAGAARLRQTIEDRVPAEIRKQYQIDDVTA
ncbi:MAG: hypothetical protein QG656_962 [Candidatus Hydrogenedentes bacterium]|nr:hypothetical protein [Candidatus Hydrogenedentota bacterium]